MTASSIDVEKRTRGMATVRRGPTFAGANVFLSRSLVPPEVFDALHDALKLNGATVTLCCDPSRTAANDYHVIASSNHVSAIFSLP